MKEIIKTEGLKKIYGKNTVVDSLDMCVSENSIYGFLGPNGAGKSTTLKMLLDLVHPTEGKIEIFGKVLDGKNRADILAQTGSLIETPSYYGHLSARENLEIFTTILDLPRKNIDEVLKTVRLDKHQHKKIRTYSLGMKQRFGIASALLSFPRLVILDEPTNGLDPSGIQEIRELIRSLPQRYGMTVLISSHILSEIDRLVDHVGILARGKMKYQGTLEALHHQAATGSLEDIFIELTGEEESL